MKLSFHKNNLLKPHFNKIWVQNHLVCHCIDDWNSLPEDTRNLFFNSFKIAISNS